MSATKMFPRLFAVVSPAIVALVTVKWRSLNVGADPPLQSLATVQKTWAVKVPVPSAMIGGWVVSPERPPGTTDTVAPLSVGGIAVVGEPGVVWLERRVEA